MISAKIGSPDSDPNTARSTGADSTVASVWTSAPSANSISPSPVATRPRFLARLLPEDRKRTTPMSTSTGPTREMSNASTWVIKVLPRFAPSMTARAGARSMAPFAANEVAINPVAVLL
jgi:hypothetical protein